MTINLKNLLNPKAKPSKMGEFQELKAIEGLQANALTLVAPTAAKDITIKTRNERYRHVANVRDFEMTTSREQVDLTNLGDEFRNQYEAGLISGQGTMNCIWEHQYYDSDRKIVRMRNLKKIVVDQDEVQKVI